MATGLIQDNMARPDGQELTPEAVRANIKMPPELQNAYERVVIAGMKLMFSQQTRDLMLKEINGQGSTGEKLGKGVAGLMAVLFQKSNKTMPPPVIIPAALELMMQAVEFVRKTNLLQVSNKDIGEAVAVMLNLILRGAGIDPQQVVGALNQYDNKNVDAAAQRMGG